MTSARLNGTVPVDIDRFTIRVIVFAKDSIFSLIILVWMGSRPHGLDCDCIITRWISFSDASLKYVKW